MVLIENIYVEAIRRRTLEPEPIAAFRKVLIGKNCCVYGIRVAIHEFVDSVLLGHDEVFHDIGLALWTGKFLSKQSSAKQNQECCYMPHRSTSRKTIG
jgi:hypothetical protein